MARLRYAALGSLKELSVTGDLENCLQFGARFHRSALATVAEVILRRTDNRVSGPQQACDGNKHAMATSMRWQQACDGNKHAMATSMRWQQACDGNKHAMATSMRWQQACDGNKHAMATSMRWQQACDGNKHAMATSMRWQQACDGTSPCKAVGNPIPVNWQLRRSRSGMACPSENENGGKSVRLRVNDLTSHRTMEPPRGPQKRHGVRQALCF